MLQGALFIPQNEFIDMTIFQGFINSPDPINKLTEVLNKQTVRENKQTQTVIEKTRPEVYSSTLSHSVPVD